MSYCTALDLLDAYGPDLLSQAATPAPWQADPHLIADAIRVGTSSYSADEQTCAAETLARIATKIEQGKARIDAYIGARVALPINPIPLILKKLNEELAFYYLWLAPGEDVRQLYTDAMKMLKDIAEGLVVLVSSPPTNTPAQSNVPEFFCGGIFPKGALNEYR